MTNDDTSYEYYQKEIAETGRFTILLDWDCSPLWFKGPKDDIFNTVEVEDMPISEELKQAFIHYNTIYQSWLDWDDPREPGLSDPKANELFWKAIDREGRALCHRLREELPDNYEVEDYD